MPTYRSISHVRRLYGSERFAVQELLYCVVTPLTHKIRLVHRRVSVRFRPAEIRYLIRQLNDLP